MQSNYSTNNLNEIYDEIEDNLENVVGNGGNFNGLAFVEVCDGWYNLESCTEVCTCVQETQQNDIKSQAMIEARI